MGNKGYKIYLVELASGFVSSFRSLLNRVKSKVYVYKKSKVLNVTVAANQIIERGFYSQEGQDIFLNEFINKKNGFFIDIGAADGLEISNSYYFENIGWNGIAVEPNIHEFDQLRQNRKCKCINACIGAKSNNEIFLQIEGPAKHYSGLLKNFNLPHLKTVHYHLNKHGGKINYLEVSVLNIMDLCKNDIDILFIDTEGSEYEILSSISFNQVCISTICVENYYSEYKIYSLLISNQYQLFAKTTHDEIYIKNDLLMRNKS